MKIFYPDETMRGATECQDNGRKVRESLVWLGIDPRFAEVEVCESGQAFCGLVEILPAGSIQTYCTTPENNNQ